MPIDDIKNAQIDQSDDDDSERAEQRLRDHHFEEDVKEFLRRAWRRDLVQGVGHEVEETLDLFFDGAVFDVLEGLVQENRCKGEVDGDVVRK